MERKRQHQADRTLKAARTAANRTNLMCEEEGGLRGGKERIEEKRYMASGGSVKGKPQD